MAAGADHAQGLPSESDSIQQESQDMQIVQVGGSRQFSDLPKIEDRYGAGIRGLRLQQAVFSDYDVSHNRIHSPWFTNGKPTFEPHFENHRDQDSVISSYVNKILRFGVVQGVRGEPWGLMTPCPPYPMLTWGTLIRATYRAFEQYPTNPQVIATKAAGLSNVTLLHRNLPKDLIFPNYPPSV